ncbi:MAG: hypothetical protein MJE77_24575, partial [Proteobacteria bacterium]|nr:hypothetical protein [Pseudomonadota bacterium]
QTIVDHLVRARLLVIQTGDAGAGASVEIVHESLIHTWPQLGRWLDENQDDAAFLDQLRTAAKQWQAKGRPNGLLWRGEAMRDAQHFARRYRGQLPEAQRAYLHAVIKLAARSTRRKRWAIAITISFLSLLVAAAAVALVLIHDAEQQTAREANRARAAEQQTNAQLARTLAEAEARQKAEQQLQKQLFELEQANRREAVAKTEVQQINRRLRRLLRNEKRSRKKERRLRKQAIEAKLRADEQRHKAEQAQENLEATLAELQVERKLTEIVRPGNDDILRAPPQLEAVGNSPDESETVVQPLSPTPVLSQPFDHAKNVGDLEETTNDQVAP